MTRYPTRLLLAASILFTIGATSTVGFQNGPPKPDDAASATKDDELSVVGKKATDDLCTQCHGLEDVTARRRTPREWNSTVTEMVDRGANGTDDQIATVKRYLTRYYGIVSVNTAAAADLSSVLGLYSKDADAVVEYRKAHGNFPDAGALLNVPGIDKTKINAQPDALHFD